MSVPAQAGASRREAILATIPAWYSPALHLAIPSLFGLAILIAAAWHVEALRPVELLAIPVTYFLGLGFEWRVHKSVLHRRLPLVGELYARHELQHHVVYTYAEMSMKSPRELRLILMPAYAVVLSFAMMLPGAFLAGALLSRNVALLHVATSMVFFLVYEWLHCAYHLPERSAAYRLPFLRWMRELHRRHHDPRLMKRWNFNVTLPLFDVLYGTLWSPAREAAKDAAREARRRARRAA